jgi:NAD(P)H-hydrate epimerase
MNKNNSGAIKIIDIGIPPQANTHVGPGELVAYYPRPTTDSHKRDNGVVLIIGGGPYYGAPALAALAAYRTGTDLVHITTPKCSAQPIACYSPNYIVHSLSEEILTIDDLSIIQSLIEQATSIVIGPGLGNAIETKDAIQEIINTSSNLNKPIVIDADAIQPFAEIITLIQNPHIVVTPHAGEYQKLTRHPLPQNLPDRIKHITKWAQKHSITVLFKGSTDIISDGTTTKLNITHNPAMTVGGTGDVLAGITGALLSKKVTPFLSGCIAAFINGAAGNTAFSEKSYGILATDIIEHIPTVLQKYL